MVKKFQMNNLYDYATQVWDAQTIPDKKLILNKMIDQIKDSKQMSHYSWKIDRYNSLSQLDLLASLISLEGVF